MQRHERDVIFRIDLIGVGNERNLFKEFIYLHKFTGNTNKFLHVFFATSRLNRVFGNKFGKISTSFHGMAQHRTRTFFQHGLTLIKELHKRVDSANSCGTNASFGSPTQSKCKRNASFIGICVNFGDSGVANAALWHVEDTLNAHFVKRVRSKTQIRQRIFNFTAIVELGSADHFVGNSPVS